MHSSVIFTILAVTATFTAAAPTTDAKNDDTVCAPGTGFFQSCGNGFRGCCKADACSLGYCPDVTAASYSSTPEAAAAPIHSQTATADDPTVCAPGTGFFQSCSNGFRGCCKQDACTLGHCPELKVREPADDPTVCAPGTGFFQSCSNGFRGCCKQDACTTGYCPDLVVRESAVKRDETICAPGTGFFQSCSNGFRGCCKQDACTLGHCPELKVREPADDPTVCAPGTGFFQSCSNGFRGCCKQDACTIGFCPDVKAFETVTKSLPKSTSVPTPTPAPAPGHEPGHVEHKSTDPTVCAPGTGFFQSCSNGFRGCCKKDACTIGYCPSN